MGLDGCESDLRGALLLAARSPQEELAAAFFPELDLSTPETTPRAAGEEAEETPTGAAGANEAAKAKAAVAKEGEGCLARRSFG